MYVYTWLAGHKISHASERMLHQSLVYSKMTRLRRVPSQKQVNLDNYDDNFVAEGIQ